jgi:5'(3')-deoxyribonucleotidase
VKTTISFDIDGVLARFDKAFVAVINDLFDKNLPADYSPNSWEYSEVLTLDEMDQAFKKIKTIRNFWHKLEHYDKNIDSLQRFLHDECHHYDVYYITSRMDTEGESALGQTAEWLIDRDLLLYNTSLLVVRDPKEKNHILRGLNVKFSIDDYLPTVIQSAAIPNHQAYLLNRSWNRTGRPDDVPVVNTVREYLEEIRASKGVLSQ